MISKAIWWAVGGLVICIGLSVSVRWALIVTIATAAIGAL